MSKYTLLSILFSYALTCEIFYNKDLKFDFEDLEAINLLYGNDGKALYISICSLLNFKCVKSTRWFSIKNIVKQIESYSTDQTDSLLISSQDSCISYSNQSGVDKEQVILVEDRQPFKGIILKRRGIVEKDVVSLKLECSPTETVSIIDDEDDQFLFTLSTISACPILLQNPIISFFDNFKWMFSVVLWAVGIFLLVFGYNQSQLSSIIIAVIFGFCFAVIVIGEATLDYDSSLTALCVVVGAGVVIAIFYCNASIQSSNIRLFNFGLGLGAIISLMAQSLFYYKIHTSLTFLTFGVSTTVLGILFNILYQQYNQSMRILSTSYFGVYCIVRPLLMFVGGYPNELLLTKQSEYGFPIKSHLERYFFNALIVLLATIHVIYQKKQQRKIVAVGEQFLSDFQQFQAHKMWRRNQVIIPNCQELIEAQYWQQK